jgi:hypothetical protein
VAGTLRFRSARVELRILLKPDPDVDPVRRRAVVSVRSLEAVAATLDERGMAYTRLSGLTWTDRRLSLLDPGGNRVELKQEWRYGVFKAVDRDPAGRRQVNLRTGESVKNPQKAGDNA